MTRPLLGGIPSDQVPVPDVVRSLAGGHPLRCAWVNSLGGRTFEVRGAARYIKWAPPGSVLPLLA